MKENKFSVSVSEFSWTWVTNDLTCPLKSIRKIF